MEFTYKDTWWLGYFQSSPPEQSAANLRLYYTYPDSVYTGQKFNVGITLEYIRDNTAKLNWIDFSNVSVGLRKYFSNYETDISSRLRDSGSTLIKPGEYYNKSFTLTAPNIRGKYVVVPAWNAFYGPGTTADNSFRWDLGSYYNHTERNVGVIYPNSYPPITVLDKDQPKKEAILKVEIDSPYGTINNKTNVKITNIKTNIPIPYSNCTGMENKKVCELPINSTYAVEVNKTINLVPNSIRAFFVTWTDGLSTNIRNITLFHDEDLYAIYKTQYHLTVGSSIKNNDTSGTGWYYAGSEAPFSANSATGSIRLLSFDHWTGDIPSGQVTANPGSLTMDNPKKIIALWKPDYGIIGTIIGILSGTIAIFSKFRQTIYQFIEKFRPFVHWKK